MDADSKAEIKATILDDLEAVKAAIKQLEENTKPISPDKALGRLTRMEGLNDKGVRDAALNQAREKLYKLEQSLSRIEDPKFGICMLCQQPISMSRMMALPESNRCVRCA